jgi:hypothetical protein
MIYEKEKVKKMLSTMHSIEMNPSWFLSHAKQTHFSFSPFALISIHLLALPTKAKILCLDSL